MATLDPLRAEVRTLSEKAVKSAAEQIQVRLKVTSPHVTFRLRDSTTVVARGLTAEARAAVDYASYVAEGTRPHTIRPKRKKVLSFIWPQAEGRVWFPKVNHPGTTGNKWWDEGLGKWNEYLSRAFR